MKTLDLGKDNIWKLLLKYAIPATLMGLVSTLYFIVDGIFIGVGIGPKGLAAIGIISPFISFGIAISNMLIAGGSAIFTKHLGKKEHEQASQSFSLIFIVLYLSTIVISTLTLVFNSQLVSLLGASPEITGMVTEYIVIISIFNAAFMLPNYLARGLSAIGKPNISAIILVSASVLNIILDYFFIIVFKFGMTGAAFATGSSMLVGLIALLIVFIKDPGPLKFVIPKLDFNTIKRTLTNGASVFLGFISGGFNIWLLNQMLMKELGTAGVSAFSIVGFLDQLIFVFIFGAVNGLQPLISFNYGAKNYKRVKMILLKTLSIVTLLGIIATAFTINFSEPILSLFTKDQNIINIAFEGVKLYAFMYIFMGINMLGNAYFTALGKAKKSLIITVFKSIIFTVSSILILTNLLGITGVWLALPVRDFATWIITIPLIILSIKSFNELESNNNTEFKSISLVQ